MFVHHNPQIVIRERRVLFLSAFFATRSTTTSGLWFAICNLCGSLEMSETFGCNPTLMQPTSFLRFLNPYSDTSSKNSLYLSCISSLFFTNTLQIVSSCSSIVYIVSEPQHGNLLTVNNGSSFLSLIDSPSG
jgi:hypothetical protein